MDETNTTVEEQTADQRDAFIEGWDEADTVEEADQPAETEEAATEQSTESEAEPEAEAQTSADPTAEAEQEPVERAWTIKRMGEEQTIKASEVTAELLQKGLDYDRVRGKYDEAKPVMEMFTEFAKAAGMSVTDYARYIRAEAKKASGMSEAEAKRAVELEDREAAVAAKEAEAAESRSAKEAGDARIKADLAEFANAFPDIYEKAKGDPKVIPQSVWNDVANGKMSLTVAYSKYAVAQANELAKAATTAAQTNEKNLRNASRSTGSMKSAGDDSKSKDAFAAAFDEG